MLVVFCSMVFASVACDLSSLPVTTDDSSVDDGHVQRDRFDRNDIDLPANQFQRCLRSKRLDRHRLLRGWREC
ncbi:MAG: hypothetical protein MZU84_07365 [Sphingobacterium sp.]|nr:hypothetical protein [Sphingobacterium sp.]